MNLAKLIEEEVRKAVAQAVTKAVGTVVAGMTGAPAQEAEAPAAEPRQRRRRMPTRVLGEQAHGRVVERRLSPGSQGRTRVRVRCLACGDERAITLDAFRRNGCRACQSRSRSGVGPIDRVVDRVVENGQPPEVLLLLAKALPRGEVVEGTAADLASRLDPAPSARWVGAALGRVASGDLVVPDLTVEVAGSDGRVTLYRLLRTD